VTTAVQTHLADTAVTIISVEEQATGRIAQLRQATRPDHLADVYRQWTDAVSTLAAFTILSFTEPAMRRYAALARLRPNIGRMDLRIAAIALEHGAAVVTCNRTDFARVPGLTIADWSV
jgi:tRNA(fMet)-specific endonuclease VapC